MAITKSYKDFKEMIASVRTISASLAQSISPEVQDEDTLRALLLENIQWYNDNPIQRSDYPSITHRCYFTGSGLGFTWDRHIDGSVTCTLRHPSRKWHKDSTLLSKAWLAGFRGQLPFEYTTTDALHVTYAVRMDSALRDLRVYHAGFERVLEAVRNDSIPDLLINLGNEIKECKARTEIDDDEYEYDDNLSDDELLGIKK